MPHTGSQPISLRSRFAGLHQAKGNLLAFMDIFGVTKTAQKTFFRDIQNAVNQLGNEDGKVVLSNGKEIDINSIGGLTTFTTHLQFLQAHMELVNNIFSFTKNFENKLNNLGG